MGIRRLPTSPILPALLALLLGLSATSLLYAWVRAKERDTEQLVFERKASYRTLTIRQGLGDMIDAVDVLNQAYTTFAPVTREQFAAFTEPLLRRYPFVNFFAYSSIVRDAEREAYEARMRREAPGFAITEMRSGQLVPAARRPRYLVLEQLAPSRNSILQRGFDGGSQAQIDAALNLAVDNGRVAASSLFSLDARQPHAEHLVVLKPVYQPRAILGTAAQRREVLLGYTSIGLSAHALFENILAESEPGAMSEVKTAVYAGGDESKPETLAYSDASSLPQHSRPAWWNWLPPASDLRYAQTIEIGGMPWKVVVTHAHPVSPGLLPGSLLVAVFGGAISLLAAGYLRLVGSGTHRIKRLVAERTEALHAANARLTADIQVRERIEAMLRRTERRLTNAQRIAHVGSWEVDLGSGMQHWSDECFRIFGLEPEPGGLPSLDRLPEQTRRVWRDALALLSSGTEDLGHGLECRIVRPDGLERHVMLLGERAPDQQQMQTLGGSVLDITEFKRVETEVRQSQASLRELGSHQERIKEGERKRIAREIHDELGGLLTGIKAYVSVASSQARKAQAADEPGNPLLEEAMALTDTALETVRRVIADLRPSVLDQLGVWEAIEWQASQVEAQSGIHCRCVIDPGLPPMDSDSSVMLFRIVQEALTNVARHSGASSMALRVWRAAERLILEVEDDGVGLAENAGAGRPSWGLRGMGERAHYLGGTLELHGRPEGGTLVRLSMPLPVALLKV